MNNLNVFRLIHSRSKSYYLTHPWEWFKDFGYCLRDAYQRITRGYADTDWFNMDSHLLELLPAMLKELAAHSYSYPSHGPFNTPEKWSTFIHSLADRIESCKEEEQDKRNEYYDDYMRELMSDGEITWNYESDATDSKDLHAKYFARSKELWEEAQHTIEETLLEMGKYFFALWS